MCNEKGVLEFVVLHVEHRQLGQLRQRGRKRALQHAELSEAMHR